VPYLIERQTEEYLTKRLPLAQTDSVKLEKMEKGYAQGLIDIQHVIDKIVGADEVLGVFNRNFKHILNELRAAASAAWLGNVAAASVHEVARSQMLHGLGPMAKSMGMLINPTDLMKANLSELRALSMGLDVTSAKSTAMMRADIDDAVPLSGLGSFSSRHVDKVYKWSGMNHMIAWMKNVEAVTFMTDVVNFAVKQDIPKVGSGAYKAAMRNFTRIGLSKGDFKRILKEVADGGIIKQDGVWLIDAAKLKNGEFIEKFRSIVATAGETAIVKGGKGAIPIVMDNPIGRSVVQFKRVFFGYQGRMESLALSLSEGDMRVASGLVTSFAMTWMAWQVRMFLKHFINDPETAADEFAKEWDASPIQDHIYRMIAGTGYTGLALVGLEQLDKATKGGLSHAINTNVGSKHFKGDGTIIANMIPSLTYAEKALSVVTAPLKEGGITRRDIKTTESIIHLNTLMILDPIMSAISRAIGETIDEPSKRVKAAADKEGVEYR